MAKLLPLTYTVSGIKSAFDGGYSAPWWAYFVLLAFLMLFLFPAMRSLGKKFE